MLVGTSLIVIIPEGIETLYEATEGGHETSSRSLRSRSELSIVQDIWARDSLPVDIGLRADTAMFGATGPDDGRDTADELLYTTTTDETSGENPATSHSEPKTSEPGRTHDPHAWVGVSLISGFILMYLIDTLPRQASASSNQQPQHFSISLTSFSFNRRDSSNTAPETPTQETFVPTSSSHAHDGRPSSTTIGLVIHAAADGIALGASSTSSSRKLSFIIFLALMIHKAPAAFGLTTVLLKQGLSKRQARTHLLIFSLAAPVGALLTWSAAHLLGFSSSMLGESTSTEFTTGVLLLFSGGTFLYVAMHTMSEASSSSGHEHGGAQENGYLGMPAVEDEVYGGGGGQGKETGGGMLETVVTVVGMLLPLLTQWGHAH